MQGLSYEFETEGATCYIELALRVPVSAKNLKIHGCQRWCSEFRRVPGTRGTGPRGTRANSSPDSQYLDTKLGETPNIHTTQ